MKIEKILSVVALTAMLAACGSKKDANESNFSAVIDNHWAKACVGVDPTKGSLLGPHEYPAAVILAQADGLWFSKAGAATENAKRTEPYNALVAAGLLTGVDGTTKNPYGNNMVPSRIYSLTGAGTKALRVREDGKTGTEFCAGHLKVDSIVRFTPPADSFGHTMSEVVYTVKAIDVPAWVAASEMKTAYPGLTNLVANGQKFQTTLVLASDGWIMNEDFGRQ